MYYNKEIGDVLKEFSTGPSGLTEEAVAKSRETYGENKLYESLSPSVRKDFSDFPGIFRLLHIVLYPKSH